jgi:GNAT superfamily N-acetyltransferase
MSYNFRKAVLTDVPQIWEIIQQAILRRKKDGSQQWQDGYPNESVIEEDIKKRVGYVLTDGNAIAGYTAIMINDEPAYADLEGEWLTNEDFVVVHRLAVSDEYIGQGLAQKMMRCTEDVALENDIFSVKVDTNFDNIPMLKIFEKLGYAYCGEVMLRGGIRKAFEKIIIKPAT